MSRIKIAALVAATAVAILLGAATAHAQPSSGWGAPVLGAHGTAWD